MTTEQAISTITILNPIAGKKLRIAKNAGEFDLHLKLETKWTDLPTFLRMAFVWGEGNALFWTDIILLIKKISIVK